MNRYKMFNQRTGEVIRIVKANNPLEVMKKYNLFTKENINIKLLKI